MSIMFAPRSPALKRAANTICLARSEKLSNIDPKIAQVKCVSMDIMPCKQFARTCLVNAAVTGKVDPSTHGTIIRLGVQSRRRFDSNFLHSCETILVEAATPWQLSKHFLGRVNAVRGLVNTRNSEENSLTLRIAAHDKSVFEMEVSMCTPASENW